MHIIRVFKSTAFSPVSPSKARLTGYEYHAYPVDIPVSTTGDDTSD